MSLYQEHALDGASAIDLVVALYDGMIRFLHRAARAVDRGDVAGRRAEVKRALDIILHLQARLRMDVGGEPAQVLSEYYASLFAEILQASRGASRAKFEHAIACVRTVRDAWKKAAQDQNATAVGAGALLPMERSSGSPWGHSDRPPSESSRWTV